MSSPFTKKALVLDDADFYRFVTEVKKRITELDKKWLDDFDSVKTLFKDESPESLKMIRLGHWLGWSDGYDMGVDDVMGEG